MIPFADMFNHSSTDQTSWKYDSERKGFVVKANGNIKKGDQIPFSYGKFTNT